MRHWLVKGYLISATLAEPCNYLQGNVLESHQYITILPQHHHIHLLLLPDDSLNLNSVIRALAKVKDWDSFGQTLGVVYSRREVIRERYSSKDQRKEATWSYWLQYMPEVSWNELASKLYYKEEFTALQAVLPYVHKTTGISTSGNMYLGVVVYA